jgi:hypothetical protein
MSKQPSSGLSSSTNSYSGYGISKSNKPPLPNTLIGNRAEEEAKVSIRKTSGMY